jgi:hypothetical protein
MPKRAKSIMSLAVALTAGAAYAGAALAQAQAPAPAQAPTIDVANQKLNRNTVTINDVNLPTRGFVAIHTADANGEMTNRILGYAPLRAGDHKGVKVRLRGEHKAGETLWVVVHEPRARPLIGAGGRGNIGQPFMQKGLPVDKSFQTL